MDGTVADLSSSFSSPMRRGSPRRSSPRVRSPGFGRSGSPSVRVPCRRRRQSSPSDPRPSRSDATRGRRSRRTWSLGCHRASRVHGRQASGAATARLPAIAREWAPHRHRPPPAARVLGSVSSMSTARRASRARRRAPAASRRGDRPSVGTWVTPCTACRRSWAARRGGAAAAPSPRSIVCAVRGRAETVVTGPPSRRSAPSARSATCSGRRPDARKTPCKYTRSLLHTFVSRYVSDILLAFSGASSATALLKSGSRHD